MTADVIAGATPKPVPTWAVITVLSLAGTTVSLQQTLVIPLLPGFQHLLQVSADDISWLVTATLLTAAVATPIVARLADMYGKRLMMLVCIVLMTAGSLVAALSAGDACRGDVRQHEDLFVGQDIRHERKICAGIRNQEIFGPRTVDRVPEAPSS